VDSFEGGQSNHNALFAGLSAAGWVDIPVAATTTAEPAYPPTLERTKLALSLCHDMPLVQLLAVGQRRASVAVPRDARILLGMAHPAARAAQPVALPEGSGL
jgi:hypothetical protein